MGSKPNSLIGSLLRTSGVLLSFPSSTRRVCATAERRDAAELRLKGAVCARNA